MGEHCGYVQSMAAAGVHAAHAAQEVGTCDGGRTIVLWCSACGAIGESPLDRSVTHWARPAVSK
jgi:hypothetical protein